MKFSIFADKLANQSGIGQLMDDLCDALAPDRNLSNLGGGNPAHIPQVQQIFRKNIENMLTTGNRLEQAIGNYDPPQGNPQFRRSLAEMLAKEFHWPVTAENIALTNGSQHAFFLLFNMFAGPCSDGIHRKILFPMAPEYIGYRDAGLSEAFFESAMPSIEIQDELFFKYHIDFDTLKIADTIGALCVSRPTNPTGNVLTNAEIAKLASLAKAREIPLLIDNAYGTPFPDIIFTEAAPYWDENTIVCMSLSKLGMPSARTGIVIAPQEVAHRIARMNAIINLAPGGIGTAMAAELVQTGQILSMSRDIIHPFYKTKQQTALKLFKKHLGGMDVCLHRPEGAFFLWAWFKNLPVQCQQFYQDLKDQGVIVVPGHHFFFGLDQQHPHAGQCLRLNYAQDQQTMEDAFKIMAQTLKKYA